MAKIRVQKFFHGVRDGEHYPRAFIEGVCYELADDGGDPPRPVPNSLLAVAVAEGWAKITEKGTPAEPELTVDVNPHTQRQMAEDVAKSAAVAALELAEENERKQAEADEAARLAAEATQKDIEGFAAKEAEGIKARREAKEKADKELAAQSGAASTPAT